MAQADIDRFNDAMAYLQNVNGVLAADVQLKLATRVEETGKDISLGGFGYHYSGTADQHNAVRALLLCQKAYLTPPHFLGLWNGTFGKDTTKRHYNGKLEQAVQEAIKCYMPKLNPTLQDLVDAAKTVNQTSGGLDFYTLTRSVTNLGDNPICFAAVRMWLFKAGFVSLRWYASAGFGLLAHTANTILGDGRTVEFIKLKDIPAGHIFNFHAAKSKATCHWGLSLGGGLAIAANTTQQYLQSDEVQFITGNSFYGKFKLEESYDACRWKYALVTDVALHKTTGYLPDIVIRDIDPTAVHSYF
jgi:hypothetical protein